MCDTPNEDRERWRLREIQFDYAWKWFEYHARQRVFMFNFFIVGVGVWGAALARLLTSNQYGISAIVAFLGIIISIIFRRLDYRNQVLVHVGEKILYQLEKEWLFTEGDSLFLRQNTTAVTSGILKWDVNFFDPPKLWSFTSPADVKKGWTHSKLIPLLENWVAFIFFLILLYSLGLQFDFLPSIIAPTPGSAG